MLMGIATLDHQVYWATPLHYPTWNEPETRHNEARHACRSGLERDTVYVAGLPNAATAAALTCIVERTLSDRSWENGLMLELLLFPLPGSLVWWVGGLGTSMLPSNIHGQFLESCFLIYQSYRVAIWLFTKIVVSCFNLLKAARARID